MDGFLAAMGGAGLAVPAEYIRWGDWEYLSGVEQCDQLLNMNVKPTAIFAMNDVMATGCYRSIKNRGLNIPADISVVGFDNQSFAKLVNPPLTTVELPNREIGRNAARLLLKRLEKQDIESPALVLPCNIIERESVAGRAV
jgi:DNA-binding LacI/PurR family transcriptional regulator